MSDNNGYENTTPPQQYQQQPQEQYTQHQPKRKNTGTIIAIVVASIGTLVGILFILGIIASVAVPGAMNQRKQAVDAAMQAQLKEVVQNIEIESDRMPPAALNSVIPKTFTETKVKAGDSVTVEIEGTFSDYGVAVYTTDTTYEDDMRGFAYFSSDGGIVPVTEPKQKIHSSK